MIAYFLRFLSCLNFRRIYNLLKLETSYFISRLTGNPKMAGLPWAISIEPTTSCNLSCPECPSGLKKFTRPAGTMGIGAFRQIIDQLSPHLLYLTLYFQGEPMLNHHFFSMVDYAKKQRIMVATSTNGHFLDTENARKIVESGLDRLIFSMDGMDQETYVKYRAGGNLEKVKQGIANVLNWKKKLGKVHPLVELQFLVLGTNEHQLPLVKDFAREMKVDKLSLKTAQLYDFGKDNPLHTSIPEYSRYRKTKDGAMIPKNSFPNRCHRMWHAPVITWDGKIVPCCFDKDADHILGGLPGNSFAVIWESREYQAFRNKIYSSRKEVNICRNCTEGL